MSSISISPNTTPSDIRIIGEDIEERFALIAPRFPSNITSNDVIANQRNNNSPPTWIATWDIFIVIMVLISTLDTAYTMAFDVAISLSSLIGLIIDLILLLDIILQFKFGEFKHSKSYLKITLHIFTAMPLQLFSPNSAVIIKLILLSIRFLCKAVKLQHIIKQLNGYAKQRGKRWVAILRITKGILVMLLCSYMFACIIIRIGFIYRDQEHESWLDNEIDDGIDEAHELSISNRLSILGNALLWAIINLFTTGYSWHNVEMQNNTEKLLETACVLLSSFYFSFLISSFHDLIHQNDHRVDIENTHEIYLSLSRMQQRLNALEKYNDSLFEAQEEKIEEGELIRSRQSMPGTIENEYESPQHLVQQYSPPINQDIYFNKLPPQLQSIQPMNIVKGSSLNGMYFDS